jgi:hypothetical protein
MESLVLELQRESMNPATNVTDLLRKAVVVATKLGITEFKEWAEYELHGYKDEEIIPQYRHLKGEIKATHPHYGLIPFLFKNPETAEMLSTRSNKQPIGELQHLLDRLGPNGTLQMPYPPGVLNQLDSGNLELGIVPTLIIDGSRLFGILEAVRNIILDWSLKLEANGILGEGMTFSPREKDQASSVTYNIGQLTGIAGNVHARNVQIGDYAAVHAELKNLGIPQKDRNELENILDALKSASGKDRESLLKRGVEWVLTHADKLGRLADMIRKWFESSSF